MATWVRYNSKRSYQAGAMNGRTPHRAFLHWIPANDNQEDPGRETDQATAA